MITRGYRLWLREINSSLRIKGESGISTYDCDVHNAYFDGMTVQQMIEKVVTERAERQRARAERREK